MILASETGLTERADAIREFGSQMDGARPVSYTHLTDLSQLQRELATSSSEEDAWAEYADKYNDDEDDFDDEE